MLTFISKYFNIRIVNMEIIYTILFIYMQIEHIIQWAVYSPLLANN